MNTVTGFAEASASQPSPLVAGFGSAASNDPVVDDPAADEAQRRYQEELRRRLNPGDLEVRGDQPYPYNAKFMRSHLGLEVYNCGNCLHMAGNKKEPVSEAQIRHMIDQAIKLKNYKTLYMFDHKGNAQPKMGEFVQDVIKKMGLEGTISVATDLSQYPAQTSKAFDKWLRAEWDGGAFNSKAQAEGGRPGFKVPESAGFRKPAVPVPA